MRLIFLPEYEDEWTIKGYNVGIWNDTTLVQLYYVKILKPGKTNIEKRGEIRNGEIKSISFLQFHEINDTPEFQLKFWIKDEEQIKDSIFSIIKIKAKQFFAKNSIIPGTDTKGIIYDLKNVEKSNPKSYQDLSEYTLDNISLKAFEKAESNVVFKSSEFDLERKVNFKNEIDLHIHLLSADHHKLSKQDKFQLQIKCAEEFLEEAIKIGADKIFFIHGIGKGKLKDGIKEMLHKHPNVKRFKNEYHHRYGYGATEVDLR